MTEKRSKSGKVGLQEGSKTFYEVWFGDSFTNLRQEAELRVEDVVVFIRSDQDEKE